MARIGRIGVVFLAAAPLLAVRPLARTLAAPIAARAAGGLGSVAGLVPVPGQRPPQRDSEASADPDPPPVQPEGSVTATRGRRQKKSHRVHVPRAAVVRAMARGSGPTARIVEQTDEHPAGILILTVGTLRGLLASGDVITDVGGVAASSEQAVIAAVAQAQQAEAKVVSGHIWRRGEYLTATAETPWSCVGCTAQNWQHP